MHTAAEIIAMAIASETDRYSETRRYSRQRLRLLDACLQQLEDLHEQDHVLIPTQVASRIQNVVPLIQPGMLIAKAIEIVFSEQEPYLRPDGLPHKPSPADPMAPGGAGPVTPAPLDEAEARALTERIKAATRDVCFLLLEAHERRAWCAMGYHTWERYVGAEFGLSRSRSYELLDQGRVLRAIKAAARVRETPNISAYAAGQIKFRLSQVTETIRARTARVSDRPVMAVIADVVSEARARHARRGARRRQPSSEIDPCQLRQAIQYIAQLPPPTEVLTQLEDRYDSVVCHVSAAARWLQEFERCVSEDVE